MVLKDYGGGTPLEEFEKSLSRLTPHTARQMRRQLQEFCEFHEEDANRLYDTIKTMGGSSLYYAWEDFRKHLIEEKGKHVNTAGNYKKALNKFLKVNGLQIVRTERGEKVDGKGVKHISKLQIAYLLKDWVRKPRSRALTYVASQTGLRISDLALMTVEDFLGSIKHYDERGREFREWSEPITSQKTGVNAYVVMGPEAVQAIKNYIGTRTTGNIFVNEKATAKAINMKAGNIGLRLRDVTKPLRDQGFKITAHSFRKFYLNQWTYKGLKDYGKIASGKRINPADEAYTEAIENGNLIEKYMEFYSDLWEIHGETSALQEQVKELKEKLERASENTEKVSELEKKIEEMKPAFNEIQRRLNKEKGLNSLNQQEVD